MFQQNYIASAVKKKPPQKQTKKTMWKGVTYAQKEKYSIKEIRILPYNSSVILK